MVVIAAVQRPRVRMLLFALYALPYRAATYRGLARVSGLEGRTLIRAISEATGSHLVSFQRGFDRRRHVSLTPLGERAVEGAWKDVPHVQSAH